MGADVLPPNELLVTARKHQGISLDELSSTLNLPVFSLVALESGQFEKLHGEAFVTGYMRSYARILNFTPEQTDALISSYLNQARPLQTVKSYRQPEMFSVKLTALFQHRQYKTAYGLAVATLLLTFLGFFAVDKEIPKFDEYADSLQLQTAAGVTVISSLSDLPTENPTLGLLPTVTVVENTQFKQELGGDFKASLSFQFNADCWVEILDGDNQIIFADLQKAQQQLELTGKPPFRITLGYAPGVELSYNGEPVKLKANRTDLVKLVLGNS